MVKNEGSRAGILKNYRPMACVLNWKAPSVFLTLSSSVLLFVRKGLASKNYTFCPHTVFMGLCIYSRTAIISLYSINQSLFITERQRDYRTTRAALRTERFLLIFLLKETS